MNHRLSQSEHFKTAGKKLINDELTAIHGLLDRINTDFERACKLLLQCRGKVIVTGMGKSGHIANKIAATLASTGTPAFFLHPAEASHGDLGMVAKEDVLIALSNSGETAEVMTLLPLIKRLGISLIALTGNPHSSLAKQANLHIDLSIQQEACPLNLAPTSSTTCALVMGDALAVAVLTARGFTEEDFARTHPAGSLGRRLLLQVGDIMHSGSALPKVAQSANIRDALLEITQKRLGMTTIVNEREELVGVFTDGDIRRTLDNQQLDLLNTPITTVMTSNCKVIPTHTLASEALRLMQQYKITSLVVSADQKNILGVVHIHDLLTAGVI